MMGLPETGLFFLFCYLQTHMARKPFHNREKPHCTGVTACLRVNDECIQLPVIWFLSADGFSGPLTGFTERCMSRLRHNKPCHRSRAVSRQANAVRSQRKQFSYREAKTMGSEHSTAPRDDTQQQRWMQLCQCHILQHRFYCILFTKTQRKNGISIEGKAC